MLYLHLEVFIKLSQPTVNDHQQGLSLLNYEVSLMRKAVLQNRMTLDIIATSSVGTGAISKQTALCSYLLGQPLYLFY